MLHPEVFRVQKTGGPLVDLGIDCLSYCAFSLETDRVSRSLIIALVGNSGVNNGDRLPEIHFVFCLLGETILSKVLKVAFEHFSMAGIFVNL